MPPAPKPDAQRRRRNAVVPMLQLPPEGRSGSVPSWPWPGKPPRAWNELWATPQAAAWDRMGYGVRAVVARYARLVSRPNVADPAISAEARQLEDRLGLNPTAMLRLRWEVAANEVEQQRSAPIARPKLRAIDPAAVADALA